MPVITTVVPLTTCAVPVAVAVQLPDIMLPIGMSIVNVTSSPDMVPVNIPVFWPIIPEKLIVPVTFEPVCVRVQVGEPIPDWPISPPIIMALLESDSVPVHTPVTAADVPDDVGAGLAGVGAIGMAWEEPPHAAALIARTNVTASSLVIFLS